MSPQCERRNGLRDARVGSAANGREVVEQRHAGKEQGDEKQRSPGSAPEDATGLSHSRASCCLPAHIVLAAKWPRVDFERPPDEIRRGGKQKNDGERERNEQSVDELVDRHRVLRLAVGGGAAHGSDQREGAHQEHIIPQRADIGSRGGAPEHGPRRAEEGEPDHPLVGEDGSCQ